MGQITSSSDVLAGPCLSAMCRRVLSSCSTGLHSSCSEGPLYLWWVGSSLAAVCKLLSSFGGELLLVVVALLLSSCSRMSSNCDWDDSSLVLLRRDTFSSCDVQEATLLWQWEFFLVVAWWAHLYSWQVASV